MTASPTLSEGAVGPQYPAEQRPLQSGGTPALGHFQQTYLGLRKAEVKKAKQHFYFLVPPKKQNITKAKVQAEAT